jgi:hypothetical protein
MSVPLIPEWVLIPPSFEDKWVPILASEYKGVQVLMMKILAIVENNFPCMLSLGFDCMKAQGMTD